MEIKEIKTMKDIETYLKENDVAPDAKTSKYNGKHLTLIFNDGEYVSTKAGDIFMRRGLHQFGAPVIFDEDHKLDLPNGGTNKYVALEEDGYIIYKLIKEIYLKDHPKPTEMSEEDKKTVSTFLNACGDYLSAIRDDANEKIKEIDDAYNEYHKNFKWLYDGSRESKYPNIVTLPKYNEEQRIYLRIIIHLVGRIKSQLIGGYGGFQSDPNTLYNCTNYGSPVDSDLKEYLDIALTKEKRDELHKRFSQAAIAINKLHSKYDHLLT